MDNFLLGYNCGVSDVKKIVEAVKGFGVRVDDYVQKLSKEAIFSAVEMNKGDFSYALIQYNVELGAPMTVADFDKIKTADDSVIVIPILPDQFKATDYMQGLLDIGVTGAIFECDTSMENISNMMINGGRTRKDCKEYYGLTLAAGVTEFEEPGNVIDSASLVRYIALPDQDTTVQERADYVKVQTTYEQFSLIISQLPEETKDELASSGEYDLYLTQEVVRKEQGTSERKLDKSPNKMVKTIKKEIEFVNVTDMIGIVSLSREAGTTMIALNLAGEVAEYSGLTPSLIQLPHTNSEIYVNNNFVDVFGSSYVSHIAEIVDYGKCSNANNVYQGINFVVPNPYTDLRTIDKWDNECTYKLLLSLPGPKIIDLGNSYSLEEHSGILPNLAHLIIVIDCDVELDEEYIDAYKKFIKSISGKTTIGYVLNKCMSEPVEILKTLGINPEDSLILPKIEKEYFEKGDIIFEKYTKLKAVFNFAGIRKIEEQKENSIFKKKSVTRRKNNLDKKTYHEARSINVGVTLEIGVGGACAGVGTTHTALMIASFLSGDYNVAIVEQNFSGAFSNIFKLLNPKTNIKPGTSPKFKYNDIDFFPNCDYGQFALKYRDKYDFVVIDFGCDVNCTDFMRMAKKIIVGSMSEWKQRELFEIATILSAENCNVNYVIPFAKVGDLSNLKKKAINQGCMIGNMYVAPYCLDWRVPSSEISLVVNDIMSNSNSVGTKRKGKFGGLFKSRK